nr:MAG TPA: hypothetical protein [Caudoviricetes sp.]
MPHLRAIIFSNRFLSHPNHLILLHRTHQIPHSSRYPITNFHDGFLYCPPVHNLLLVLLAFKGYSFRVEPFYWYPLLPYDPQRWWGIDIRCCRNCSK